nr:BURP domain protein RD22-like [Nicotiana tomentosiformis]
MGILSANYGGFFARNEVTFKRSLEEFIQNQSIDDNYGILVTNDVKSLKSQINSLLASVFYCHKTETIESYMVSLVSADGTKAKAVVVCHKNISAWNPKHLAFKLLKVTPGFVSVCHFLPEDHIVWVPKN